MNAKIADFSEMGHILSVKNDVNEGLGILSGHSGLGNLLRHLSKLPTPLQTRLKRGGKL